MNLLEIAMLFLNQVIAFFQIIDDDDIDKIIVEMFQRKTIFLMNIFSVRDWNLKR